MKTKAPAEVGHEFLPGRAAVQKDNPTRSTGRGIRTTAGATRPPDWRVNQSKVDFNFRYLKINMAIRAVQICVFNALALEPLTNVFTRKDCLRALKKVSDLPLDRDRFWQSCWRQNSADWSETLTFCPVPRIHAPRPALSVLRCGNRGGPTAPSDQPGCCPFPGTGQLLHYLAMAVPSLPGHEVHALLGQAGEPLVIGVSAIKHHNRARFQRHLARYLDLRRLGPARSLRTWANIRRDPAASAISLHPWCDETWPSHTSSR